MKATNKLKVLVALSITLPLLSNVNADLPSNPFNYAKASAAYVDATNSESGMMDRIYFGGSFGSSEADNYCTVMKGCTNKDSAWKAYAGYKITEMLDAEAAYTSIGDLHKDGTASDVSALSLSAVANLSVNDQLSLFGKAGFSRWNSENTDSKKSGTGLSYGLGAKVNLSESMKLRAEWESLPSIATSNTEETDIKMLSVGVELSTF